MECHAVTGDASHLVKIRTTSPGSLEQLLSRMQEWSGVKKTLTNIILSTHHESLSIDTGTKPSTLALANGKTKHS
jgi:Lrp/AsnC family leucine-responsive transcriptional regulator